MRFLLVDEFRSVRIRRLRLSMKPGFDPAAFVLQTRPCYVRVTGAPRHVCCRYTRDVGIPRVRCVPSEIRQFRRGYFLFAHLLLRHFRVND